MPFAPLQISGPISLGNVQSSMGGTNPISMSEYYAGVTYTPTGGSVPASGAISLNNFYGMFGGYTGAVFRNGSGTYTVPAGITRIFAVIVAGGGYGGLDADGGYIGGTGGYGGLAMVYQDVTPGEVLTATVGSYGADSSFNGITATDGNNGGNASYQAPTGDFDGGGSDGDDGSDGTSTGTNYVGDSLIGANVSSASWTTYFDTMIGSFLGASNATNRTNLTSVRNQTAATGYLSSWNTVTTSRPGGRGTPNSSSRRGGPGAIMIFH